MKTLLVCLLFLVTSFVMAPGKVLAQSTPGARPTSEQSLQELVREVRQLRAALQRINATVYKGQMTIERLKLQHDQVFRLSRELTQIRENISEIRGQQLKLKQLLNRAEAGVEVGMKDPGDLAGLKAELENIIQREQRLSLRETQLSNELELERSKLNELNDRLNALELELTPK